MAQDKYLPSHSHVTNTNKQLFLKFRWQFDMQGTVSIIEEAGPEGKYPRFVFAVERPSGGSPYPPQLKATLRR